MRNQSHVYGGIPLDTTRWARRVRISLVVATRIVRQGAARWRRYQNARAAYAALCELDSRTLRDLGLHRTELRSVAVEAAGLAEPSRVRAVRVLSNLA